MATLVLAAASQAVGAAAFGSGTFLAAAAGTAGALAGKFVDNALFGQKLRQEGRRLEDLTLQTSNEGAAMARIYGRVRLSGQVIWATQLEETVSTSTQGGKSGGSGVETTEYAYFANFAVGLCEGPIHRIGRIWADGQLIDQSEYTIRSYLGGDDQVVDALIEAKQGVGQSPAFRGTAYVVFDRLPLESFGDRIPQLTFEVIRVVEALEAQIEAITLIPGATEVGYLPDAVNRIVGAGSSEIETRHTMVASSNVEAAIDEVVALCPNLKRVALVVSWFGTDLRCGNCLIEPRVEDSSRSFDAITWQVGGLSRSDAQVVSTSDDRPAYGGTPCDASVIALIEHLNSRGLKVTFYPFLMMDIPAGNTLPDPSGSGYQASYPWRGRITCDPQPGSTNSAYGTAAIRSQVSAFVGAAKASDFIVIGSTVYYVGAADWGFRRMILHYAHLCDLAGGVEAFLIGSELRALTQLRDNQKAYPFVDALVSLAGDVKSVLGSQTLVSYAADWSEFFGHQPADGSGDAVFHLDPLWASSDIDFIGIDCYWPLSDWRNGTHLDQDATSTLYDLETLKAGLTSGEGYDWYYVDETARDTQSRTPITDGAYGKPWIFRYKDLANWWSNSHYDRYGGVETGSATAWQPKSKQIWLTETGCPAVDRGSNQPNVFVDTKSSESAYPYYSRGFRDDLIQRLYLEAVISGFSEQRLTAVNPALPGTSTAMIEPSSIFIWSYDARPFPEFPQLTDVWSDGDNWYYGHWLNGRLGGVSIKGLLTSLMTDAGFSEFDIDSLPGAIDGYVIDNRASIRSHIEPIARLFNVQIHDVGTAVRFSGLEGTLVRSLSSSDLAAENPDDPIWTTSLSDFQDADEAIRVVFNETLNDFEQGSVTVGAVSAASNRTSQIALDISASGATVLRAADQRLGLAVQERRSVSFALAQTQIDLEPGDLIEVAEILDGSLLRIDRIEEDLVRRIDATVLDTALSDVSAFAEEVISVAAPSAIAPPELIILDLPLLDESDEDFRPYVAAQQSPWPGTLAVFASQSGEGYEQLQSISGPAVTAVLLSALAPGPTGLWDLSNSLDIEVSEESLESQSDVSVFAGANTLAVETASGWEVLQFAEATLQSSKVYRLSRLLRGQLGTETMMAEGSAAGACVVLLSSNVSSLATDRDLVGVSLTVKAGAASRSIDGSAYVTQEITPVARGQEPYSPVHLRAERLASGDILISWVRRTRIGGDSWAQYEVPLAEESEAYQVNFFVDNLTAWTQELSTTTLLYTAAMQQSDFGASAPYVDVSVAQISSTYGPGPATRKMIYV